MRLIKLILPQAEYLPVLEHSNQILFQAEEGEQLTVRWDGSRCEVDCDGCLFTLAIGEQVDAVHKNGCIYRRTDEQVLCYDADGVIFPMYAYTADDDSIWIADRRYDNERQIWYNPEHPEHDFYPVVFVFVS